MVHCVVYKLVSYLAFSWSELYSTYLNLSSICIKSSPVVLAAIACNHPWSNRHSHTSAHIFRRFFAFYLVFAHGWLAFQCPTAVVLSFSYFACIFSSCRGMNNVIRECSGSYFNLHFFRFLIQWPVVAVRTHIWLQNPCPMDPFHAVTNRLALPND